MLPNNGVSVSKLDAVYYITFARYIKYLVIKEDKLFLELILEGSLGYEVTSIFVSLQM